MKNDFAPPQEFNAELYDQIVNNAQQEDEEVETRPQRPIRNSRRQRRNSGDDAFGSYNPRRTRFRNRNQGRRGAREEEPNNREAPERLRYLFESMNLPQSMHLTAPNQRNIPLDALASSEEEDFGPTVRNIAKASRSDRLRQRQAIMESVRGPAGLKYKPSPVKKEPTAGLRGQWRRLRRIREEAREQQQNSWRFFDRKDVENHANKESLIQQAQRATQLDPVERHRMQRDQVLVYDRKKKKAVKPEDLSVQDDEDSEYEAGDEEEDLSNQSQSLIEDDESGSSFNDKPRHRKRNGRSYQESEEEDIDEEEYNYSYEESESLELEEDSPVKPTRKQATRRPVFRANKTTAFQGLSNLTRVVEKKFEPVKKKAAVNKVVKAKKTVKHKSVRAPMVKTTQRTISTHVETRLPKRQPKKVVDFDFDSAGNKVVIPVDTSQFNKQILPDMPRAKKAGNSEKQTKGRSVSKSTPKPTTVQRSASKTKKISNKQTPKGVSQPKTKKEVQPKIAAKSKRNTQSKSKTPVRNSRTPKKSTERKLSQSPVKGGLGNLFQLELKSLKGRSKKELKSHHEEMLQIRKIAEMQDSKDKKGRFKFGFMRCPNPPDRKSYLKDRERSREAEKYIPGKPIRHSLASLGNLNMMTYKD